MVGADVPDPVVILKAQRATAIELQKVLASHEIDTGRLLSQLREERRRRKYAEAENEVLRSALGRRSEETQRMERAAARLERAKDRQVNREAHELAQVLMAGPAPETGPDATVPVHDREIPAAIPELAVPAPVPVLKLPGEVPSPPELAVPAAAGELTADDRFTFDMLTEGIPSLEDGPHTWGSTHEWNSAPRDLAQRMTGTARHPGVRTRRELQAV